MYFSVTQALKCDCCVMLQFTRPLLVNNLFHLTDSKMTHLAKMVGFAYGKMMIHLAHTLHVRCHAPVTYSKPYRLYGVLWRPGGHKRTKGFLTLYYRPKLTFYDRNMKAKSSYFILKQSPSPPMKHNYLLFLSKLRTLWIYPHI